MHLEFYWRDEHDELHSWKTDSTGAPSEGEQIDIEGLVTNMVVRGRIWHFKQDNPVTVEIHASADGWPSPLIT